MGMLTIINIIIIIIVLILVTITIVALIRFASSKKTTVKCDCDNFDITKTFTANSNCLTKNSTSPILPNITKMCITFDSKNNSPYIILNVTATFTSVSITSPTYDGLLSYSESNPYIYTIHGQSIGFFPRTDIKGSKIICVRNVMNKNIVQYLTVNTTNKTISFTGPQETPTIQV
jgi:hypothetical protein